METCRRSGRPCIGACSSLGWNTQTPATSRHVTVLTFEERRSPDGEGTAPVCDALPRATSPWQSAHRRERLSITRNGDNRLGRRATPNQGPSASLVPTTDRARRFNRTTRASPAWPPGPWLHRPPDPVRLLVRSQTFREAPHLTPPARRPDVLFRNIPDSGAA